MAEGATDLIDRLGEYRLMPRIDAAAEFAGAHQVLLLRHGPSAVDVDLSIAWLPFELEALAAAETLEVAGVPVGVARAEDLVVYKRSVPRTSRTSSGCSRCTAGPST
jgi:hypothetical protein